MTEVDEGHQRLSALSRTYGQLDLADANEAETRFKVIDEVLTSVLGWTKDDLSVEERVSEDGVTTFADYILRTPSVAILVEAKRAGASFAVPARRTRLTLGGVLSEGDIGDATRQARDYCRKKSIPFAVVTNGNAWVIFPSVRTDQVTFEETEARVFRDLDDIQGRFIEFWELLSRQRVLDGNLADEVLGGAKRQEPGRALRNLLPEPGFRLGRNSLFEHIEAAVTLALSDEALLGNVEALEACYVKTSERLKYDGRLQMHLRDSLPPLGHPTVRLKTRKNQKRVEAQIEAARPAAPPRFVVLLGPVGAGKTTFLHYTRKVSAASAISERIVWLLVDFKRATSHDAPRTFILTELLAALEADEEFQLGDWEKSVGPAYASQVAALRRGPLYLLAKNDPAQFETQIAQHIGREREAVEPYVTTILRHAASRWPGFLVIDNVDQLDDAELQAQIFIEAQALARRIGFSVIMSLRESTFLKHRDTPAFDAFQFDSFYIDPPSVLPVLSHRFAYAKHVLRGKGASLRTERGMTLAVEDLGTFFELVSHSLLGGDAGLMIECLSGGNVRAGLTLVREFLASGHTNSDRALAAFLLDGRYRFPDHEILKGAVLGPLKYYRDEASLLPNLFDAKLGSKGLQLLRLRLVEQLVCTAEEQPSEGLAVNELITLLGRVGVPELTALQLTRDLMSRNMLRTADGLAVRTESRVYPTRLAGFALRRLCREFAYSEFCCLDTIILDAESWGELRDVTLEIEAIRGTAERMTGRSRRLEVFFRYLMSSEEVWIVEGKRRDLPPTWLTPTIRDDIWPAVRESAAAAMQSAERLYGRPLECGDGTGRSTPTDARTFTGTIVSVWVDKEYVFIREDNGQDWFAHRRDFVNDEDWAARERGKVCAFLKGEWQAKPRAISVRLRP